MANTADFFGEGYELPTTQSKYSKIEKDKELRIRILGKPLIGWEYFQQVEDKKKPVRSKEKFSKVENRAINKFSGLPEKPQEFWAFKVYNVNSKQIEIFQTTKNTIKESIMNLYQDDDYGNPTGYDLKITKKWEWTDTTYSVIPWKQEAISDEVQELAEKVYVQLENLFEWADPFDENYFLWDVDL